MAVTVHTVTETMESFSPVTKWFVTARGVSNRGSTIDCFSAVFPLPFRGLTEASVKVEHQPLLFLFPFFNVLDVLTAGFCESVLQCQ